MSGAAQVPKLVVLGLIVAALLLVLAVVGRSWRYRSAAEHFDDNLPPAAAGADGAPLPMPMPMPMPMPQPMPAAPDQVDQQSGGGVAPVQVPVPVPVPAQSDPQAPPVDPQGVPQGWPQGSYDGDQQQQGGPVNEATEVKSAKSAAYAAAGLRHFYSDGTDAVPASALFMAPSNNDIVCQLGGDALQPLCSDAGARVDNVSCRDTSTRARHSADCSGSATAVAREPLDSSDCRVRVLDGEYALVKACVTATSATVVDDSGSGLAPELRLPASAYATTVLVLLRPAFVLAAGSRLYSVVYDASNDGDATNSPTRYDSASAQPLRMRLQAVDDGVVWDPERGQGLSAAVAAVAPGRRETAAAWDWGWGESAPPTASALPVTAYYLNYVRPAQPRRALVGDGASDHRYVLSLYFELQSDAKGGSVLGGRLYSCRSPALRLHVHVGKDQAVVRTVGSATTVPVWPGALLVVTWATNLLVVCCVSPERACLVRTPRMPLLDMPDNGAAALAAIAENNGVGAPPARAFPYTNFCVPNLADLAIKTGMLV
jgi:hypothetical protein